VDVHVNVNVGRQRPKASGLRLKDSKETNKECFNYSSMKTVEVDVGSRPS